MDVFVYVHPDGIHLAERWLRLEVNGRNVVLVAEPGAVPDAERLRQAYPCVRRVDVLDPATCKSPEAPQDCPQVVVPLPFEQDMLEYRFPVQIPRVPPRAESLRTLWRAGFRAFEIYNLHGTAVWNVPHLPDAFQRLHAGRRCFVVGNGPSLNEIDMGRLAEEITLGSNRCYLGFERWGFPFTYWGISDRYQIEEYAAEYETSIPANIVKFFPMEYLPLLRLEQGCPVRFDWPREADRQFSTDPARLFPGYTVTYMLIQLAAIMGCNPIILIGVDHRYGLRQRFRLRRMARLAGRWVTRHQDHTTWYKAAFAAWQEVLKARRTAGRTRPARLWQAGDAARPTHFDSRYATGEQKRFLMPRPIEAEKDFACAARWAQEHGVRILNATPGSALTAFPMVDFDSLF